MNSEEAGGVAFISFYTVYFYLFIFLFFHLPPVAFLTLEGCTVNSSLRVVYTQSDILAEGADSASSLLRVKRKINK